MVEAQIPVPIPIPGVKLGLANIVTVYAVFVLGPWDALSILVVRVFLGAVVSGQMMTLFYSLGGGLLCWAVLVLLRRLFTKRQIWLCSPVSAIFHNLGQLLVAAALMGTWVVMAYLPYLVIAGAASGLFTGLCAQFLIGRLDRSPRPDRCKIKSRGICRGIQTVEKEKSHFFKWGCKKFSPRFLAKLSEKIS